MPCSPATSASGAGDVNMAMWTPHARASKIAACSAVARRPRVAVMRRGRDRLKCATTCGVELLHVVLDLTSELLVTREDVLQVLLVVLRVQMQ